MKKQYGLKCRNSYVFAVSRLKRMLMISLCMLYILNLNGQGNDGSVLPQVIPPSPNAAELGKYATLDVGLQTGSLGYKIPLFNIAAGAINVPVDLQYSTSGIKVDQIASRAGMGWVMNAGGVVTRVVKGRQDEVSTWSPLPTNWQSFDGSFLSYLRNFTNEPSTMDIEPDEFLFNFNGYSGKFILDDNGQAVVAPYGNLKITVSGSDGFGYGAITIVTPDGCRYQFDSRESTFTSGFCYGSGTSPISPVPTAWYLSSIILPNSETVAFSYDTCRYSYYAGISQTIAVSDNAYNGMNYCSTCPVYNRESVCTNALEVDGKILRSISYGTTTVTFDYTDRLDVSPSDDPRYPQGEGLLTKVKILSGTNPIKTYTLNYETATSDLRFQSTYGTYPELKYRPFLKSLSEQANTGDTIRKHQFSYNDINGMAPRLSYAQDLWGYFNGQINTSFVPVPELATDRQQFPNATANRTPSLENSLKGSLVKIIYPTGGSDSIVYELNDHRVAEVTPAPTTTRSATINPRPNYPFSASSSAFTPYSSDNIRLVAGIIIAGGSDGSSGIDPDAEVLDVQVIQQSDNQPIFSRILKASEKIDELLTGVSTNESYVLKITALYPNIKCSGGVTYETGAASSVFSNKTVGGLRVAKTIHDDNITKTVKKYTYAKLDSLSTSSGMTGPLFKNIANGFTFVECGGYAREGDEKHTPAGFFDCLNHTAYSSSLVDLYNYGQNHIYYSSVVESDGENFEHGGVSHSYILSPDQLSKPVSGLYLVLGARTSNTGILNGLEKEQLVFRKKGTAFIPIKRSVNSYKIDTGVERMVTVYTIKRNFDWPTTHTPPTAEEFQGFEINKYGFHSRWAYMDTSTVYSYDSTGTLYAQERTIYQYNNPLNINVSRIEKNNSKAEILQTTFLYPNDMVALGNDPLGVYQQMKNKNMLSSVIDQASFLINGSSTAPIRRVITQYWNPTGSVYVPKWVAVQNATAPVDTLLRMNVYDTRGNTLEQQKDKDAKEVYLWGYGKQYPVAKIISSNYTSVSAFVNQTMLDNAHLYTDEQIRVELNKIRLGLVDSKAQVYTYTYKPLVGMTSETDPAGRTTYYEYDSFGRLRLVKDDQGKILKRICYNYAGQPVNCN